MLVYVCLCQEIGKNISINTKQYKTREEPVYTTLIQPKDVNLAPSPFKHYDSDHDSFGYKSIKLSQTPTGRVSNVSGFDSPSRPKFEPIDKYSSTASSYNQYNQYSEQQNQYQYDQQQQHVYKPKPISAQHVSPYQSGPEPYHQPLLTETSNRMQVREQTDHSQRFVNVSQNRRVLQYDRSLPHLATPSEFVPEELRDDRPANIPRPSVSRSCSMPRSYDRVLTPMEFDTVPAQMPSKIDVSSISRQLRSDDSYQTQQARDSYSMPRTRMTPNRITRDDIGVGGTSWRRGELSDKWNNRQLQQHQQEQWQQEQQWQQKQQQWQHQNQWQQQNQYQNTPIKPILKRGPASGDASQFYRNESSVSQYGMLCYFVIISSFGFVQGLFLFLFFYFVPSRHHLYSAFWF